MPRSAPRVLALVGAPLLVVAATAFVLLQGGSGSTVITGADGPVVRIVQPIDGSSLTFGPVQVVANVVDRGGIATAELHVDGRRVDSTLGSGASDVEVRFSWTPNGVGDYTLSVRAKNLAGHWGAEAAVRISVGTGLPPLPPPPSTEPASVALVVGPVVTTAAPSATTPSPPVPVTLQPVVTVAPPVVANAPPTRTSPPATSRPRTSTTSSTTTTTTATTTPTSTTTTTTTTTTTVPTTVRTTAPPPPPPPPPPCQTDRPVTVTPANHSVSNTTPVYGWLYTTTCPPQSQTLLVRTALGGFDATLPGDQRSFQSTTALPSCTRVGWAVVATGSDGHSHASHVAEFSTAC